MKYVQCYIQYSDNASEMAWIPEEFAKVNKPIIVGKDKKTGKRGIVAVVYGDVRLSKRMVEINRSYPLKEVTDI